MKNKSLYTIEGLACICVIFIHCKFPGELGRIIEFFSRYAVPVFFIVSGYFTYDANNEKLKSKAIKLLKIFLCYIIFYYILLHVQNFITNDTYSFIELNKKIFNFKNVFLLIMLNRTSIIIPHLWFLLALVYCYIFRYFTKREKFEKLYKYIPYILILTYILSIVPNIISNNSNTNALVRNWLMYGIPFFVIGINIKNNLDRISNIKNNRLIIFSILGILLIGLERTFINIFDKELFLDVYIGNIIFVISIFILAINNPKLFDIKILSNIGEKHSLNIYLIHYAIIRIINILDKKEIINGYFKPILVFIIAYIISAIIIKVKEGCKK